MEIINNPFITNLNLLDFNELSESNIQLNYDNIIKYYHNVYILTKINNDKIPQEFYQYKIDKKIFEKVSNNLILYETSINILTL